jgi:hypothetical protein
MRKEVLFIGICFLSVGFLFSCKSSPKSKDEISVQVKLSHAGKDKILLKELWINEMKTIDSAVPDKEGNVRFSHFSAGPGFYLIALSDGRYITLCLAKGDQVVISGDFRKFPSDYTIAGSKGSELLRRFYEYSSGNKKKGDSLIEILRQHQYSDDFYPLTLSFDKIFHGIWDDQKKFEKEMIRRNLDSPAVLLILNYAFGPRPVLTLEEDLNDFRKVDSAMMKAHPENKHVIFHHKRVKEYLQKLETRNEGTK